MLANSRSVITSAVDGTTVPNFVPQTMTAVNTTPPVSVQTGGIKPPETTSTFRPVPTDTQKKPSETLFAANDKPVVEAPIKIEEPRRTRIIAGAPTEIVAAEKPSVIPTNESSKPTGPLEVGSLIAYATKQSSPIYPPAARSMRTTGVVKVEVMVDETGGVSEVQKTSGPSLLQTAAKDAVRKWKFKPFVRDGQPVKATGFVNFNFSL